MQPTQYPNSDLLRFAPFGLLSATTSGSWGPTYRHRINISGLLIVTFTTLGFGDVTPKTTKAALWVMAEVVVGYIMLGGLISILANKLARRS